MTNKEPLLDNVRVRFAPSPTGMLHIGNLRTAIFNWLFARHHKGQFLVRIEDTDRERFKPEYVDVITESLSWLGMDSDEKLVFQTDRLNIYKQKANYLLEQGLAYRCFCSAEELDVLKAQGDKFGFKYPGTCRDKTWTAQELERPHVLRLAIPTDPAWISYKDLIKKKISVNVADQLDDFIIVRTTGMPTYNFCVVIDDIDMKISHVIRGEDHISNTIKQLVLYQSLKAAPPEFAHLPMILGTSGEKLSKRHGAVSVDEYKKAGFLPEAFMNYLARLGWSHKDQEIFSVTEMAELFSTKAIGKSAAIFDSKKLEWLNGIHIRQSSAQRLLKCLAMADKALSDQLLAAWDASILTSLVDIYKDRSRSLIELGQEIIGLSVDPEAFLSDLLTKWVTPESKKALEDFAQIASELTNPTAKELLHQAKQICEKHDLKLANLAQTLRIALTGKDKTPGIFEIIPLLNSFNMKRRCAFFIQKA